MYFVDRKKIEQNLRYMESCNRLLAEHDNWTSTIDKLALERLAHTVIEAIVDTGNLMIDGFIMRDPGSYEDILDILDDEKVIPTTDATELKKLVKLRKMLVQEYTNVDYDLVNRTMKSTVSAREAFPDNIRKYLTNELGPVSAFLPDEE